jgi:hypothetical protein
VSGIRFARWRPSKKFYGWRVNPEICVGVFNLCCSGEIQSSRNLQVLRGRILGRYQTILLVLECLFGPPLGSAWSFAFTRAFAVDKMGLSLARLDTFTRSTAQTISGSWTLTPEIGSLAALVSGSLRPRS